MGRRTEAVFFLLVGRLIDLVISLATRKGRRRRRELAAAEEQYSESAR